MPITALRVVDGLYRAVRRVTEPGHNQQQRNEDIPAPSARPHDIEQVQIIAPSTSNDPTALLSAVTIPETSRASTRRPVLEPYRAQVCACAD